MPFNTPRSGITFDCPSCSSHLSVSDLHSDTIAMWILHQSLKEVLDLQTALAKHGVCLTVSTPEVFIQQPE